MGMIVSVPDPFSSIGGFNSQKVQFFILQLKFLSDFEELPSQGTILPNFLKSGFLAFNPGEIAAKFAQSKLI